MTMSTLEMEMEVELERWADDGGFCLYVERTVVTVSESADELDMERWADDGGFCATC
jgi:hypothetical protein